jgi:hypothetical protein
MKSLFPNFIQNLFSNDKYQIDLNFLDKTVKVSNAKMQFVQSKIEEILQQNIEQIKEAYDKDLLKKFPAILEINLKDVKINLVIKDLAFYSVFLTNVFTAALKNYNTNNSRHKVSVFMPNSKRLIIDYFKNHKWIEKSQDVWIIKVKSADQLHLIFSQVYHILDPKTNLDQHIKDFKSFIA